ncbi:DUF3099 domain-containing protein [Arthrobacter sp. TMN-49]
MKEQSATPKFGAGRRSKYRHGAPASDVPSITNAAAAHSDEMHQRMVRYATAMGIRMVCLASIFVFDGWFKLVPVIGAVILPWVAVVIANGGSDVAHQDIVELLDEAPLYAVDAGTDAAAQDGTTEVLTGEIVPDDDAGTERAATGHTGTENSTSGATTDFAQGHKP